LTAARRAGWASIVWAGWVAIGSAQTSDPPALLQHLLARRPEWRLIEPPVAVAGDAPEDAPRWIAQDLDGDDLEDVAAVIVRRTATGVAFSVVAVHASRPRKAHTVVPFDTRRIYGVSNEVADDTLMPLYCVECDSNAWFRWDGRRYESMLYSAGESLLFVDEPGARRLALFDAPRFGARQTVDVPRCGSARVMRVAGRRGNRWYFVEVEGRVGLRGWIPERLVTHPVGCLG
jgi:hypothetical protein